MNLQESGEMYLETILVLSKKNKDVRSIDIARELNYSKPSVSRAIGLLKKDKRKKSWKKSIKRQSRKRPVCWIL